MNYLLDTNVVSELRKPARRADKAVRSWIAARAPADLYLSAITLLEIELGIARLSRRDGTQSDRLRSWLENDLLDVFNGRILPVDVPVARHAGRLHVPDPRPERDALIAATATAHHMTVVTRNAADFEPMQVSVTNPWL
ncbi:PIN domain-containing protein [Gordonia amarae]|uniref:Ribonuclease VapC n=2 Tax=Gordonia amarae TaxID=36821 RepID=G7GQD2_9ACTN|nr:type II toxin-antitoxin system VapC family toxin [Gordonia amarae]MCS3880276.1 putative nucleic acid-binding protein [Gordonia amarae]QHN18628.1 PIN domain-containing protein [Gordonia amarae]QHN23103.1 PIN domain-containing protein [Gordonia amarae]QHN32004.1 PIN domain-containing protein [Gordonia amarae]QHN40751.1 PIN domain-containing protein [Gordonia amarae]